jgi:glycosyltransferase involved in cell wall biosynthesis
MTPIAFVWDNFGPYTVDAVEAVAAANGGPSSVIGIELFAASSTYEWGRWQGQGYTHVTLLPGDRRGRVGTINLARRIVSTIRAHGAHTVFLCHYAERHILLAAMILRLLGKRVFVLSDSKFDDYPRYLRREIGKSLYMAPYQGGIAASPRCADYMRFLGVDPAHVRLGYYGIDLDRIRGACDLPPAPGGYPFRERYFLSIARLVPKKNHAMMLNAYALYAGRASSPRRLVLCGSGPLEGAIREQAAALGIADKVDILGNVPPARIPGHVGRALALLLPSIEEQFGIVVVEAQAMGLPVILSDNCGSRDRQVQGGINGFVVEPDNFEGMASYMQWLDEDEALWTRMANAAYGASERGSVRHFVAAVGDLASHFNQD